METPASVHRPVAPSADRRNLLISWLLLIAGVSLSVALGVSVHRQVEQQAQHRFEEASRETLYRIRSELGAYEEVLVGLSAFMSSKDGVTRAEFRRYVERLDLPRRFPGFENLNYAVAFPGSELKRFEDSVRRDATIHAGGYPGFAVNPPGAREEHHVIVFIEPWERSNASVGRDLLAHPLARRILDRQRDTGQIASSGRLIRIEGSNQHVGMAVRLAVYSPGARLDSVEDRRAAFRGSVGAGFRVAAVMQAAVGSELSSLRFRLTDLGEDAKAASPVSERQLFDSAELQGDGARAAWPGSRGRFEHTVEFPVMGRYWQVQFTAPSGAAGGATGAALPWLALLASLTTTLLVTGLFRSYATSRRRAEAIAAAITRDLRESETSLAEAQRIAGLGNWSLRVSDGVMAWSAEGVRLLGGDAPGTLQGYLARIHPEDREAVRAALSQAIAKGTSIHLEHRVLIGNAPRWMHALGEARAGADGRTEVFRGTLLDISERKLEVRRKELGMAVAQIFASGLATAETMSQVVEVLRVACGYSAGRYYGPNESPDCTPAVGTPGVCLALVAEQKNLGCIELTGGEDAPDTDRIRLVEGVVQQIAQYLLRRQAEDNFKYLATHDALTGLPNRLLFGERVSGAIARAERAKTGLGVLIVDLDRFKNVNDTLGHGAGDAVLRTTAERIARTLRDSDLVARISGDEFAILIDPCLQPSAAVAVARKVLGAIERPLIVQGQEIVLTGSVGISVYHEDGYDAETLLKHADIAMFRAKESGRNNYQFYSPQMNPHSLERLGLETALRRALERNEFFLNYQPKVDLRTGAVTGVEALLRWKHAELGMISPAKFIPIAEETGLIEPIGAWVLREACAQSARWHAAGLGVRVAVNLSARQFRNQRLAREIRACLAGAALDPRLLEIELTESMVMQNPTEAAEMLRELKSMGLTLSIDDFGTGHSSLAYLKRFPLDSVKIDRSFVKDIPGDPEDVAIVEAVVALAQSLRLRVVAEGVETEEQRQHLRKVGCDELQGYLASKPLPADEATAFLKASFAKEAARGGKRSLVVAG
jgi:diguanylate cyclase (GGDEF)-like protein